MGFWSSIAPGTLLNGISAGRTGAPSKRKQRLKRLNEWQVESSLSWSACWRSLEVKHAVKCRFVDDDSKYVGKQVNRQCNNPENAE